MSLLEDGAGELWVAGADRICHAGAGVVASGRPANWLCSRAVGAGEVNSLAEVSPGHLWAATSLAGVYAPTAGGPWEQVPGSRALPTPLVRRLRPSPSGGAWIISYGTILRAVERADSEGWEIVEKPGAWDGLMISDAEDILEEDAGDLWITTLAGVVHIPPEVRRAPRPVPRVELVNALVDGKPLPRERGISLPYRRNRIELRFAALSYRDPALLRYQVRLHPGAAWLDLGRPSVQFVDLPAGGYEAEVRATLDGDRWSATPARIAFEVLPPFWETWWFVALVAFLVCAGAYAAYRFRVAQLLRLERMRTRIALDLHDDIGSSLSQIALEGELALSRLERGESGAAPVLERISDNARQLVDAMSDAVWSVDPAHDRLSDLARRIRTFSLDSGPGEVPSIHLDLPAPERETPMDADVRRQVFLVFKESLANARRHAAASRIDVRMGVADDVLELAVSDDGRGMAEGSPPASAEESRSGGHGLASMRARAASVRGVLEVTSAPGRGTTVTLRVPLRGSLQASPRHRPQGLPGDTRSRA